VDTPGPRVFANRTLNFRSLAAIGYDLDYTLVHYHHLEWEGRAYHHARLRLADGGWPVEGLEFDPGRAIQGLVIDLQLGNLLKVTRFGYVIRAEHGERALGFDEVRRAYAGEFVDLREPRWVFLNTLFSLSEATLFCQLVDLADRGEVAGVVGYDDIYAAVRNAIGEAHEAGDLKADIVADPSRFVDPDPAVLTTLRDQRAAGKHLMLISNSDWDYVSRICAHAFDPHLESGETWRDLFDTVVVSAGKPGFFAEGSRWYRVVDEAAGLLRPHFGPLETGGVFVGGSARGVEASLGVSGDEILYVGDHLFGDVHASKSMLRWRTALVMRELEDELAALRDFAPREVRLVELMTEKESLETKVSEIRLDRLRGEGDKRALDREENRARAALSRIDEEITPLAVESGRLSHPRWGLLMRAGVDKSLFARQVERHADIYMSRVSDLQAVGPYAFLRAFRSPLPHDL